jgi:hypothetical protein
MRRLARSVSLTAAPCEPRSRASTLPAGSSSDQLPIGIASPQFALALFILRCGQRPANTPQPFPFSSSVLERMGCSGLRRAIRLFVEGADDRGGSAPQSNDDNAIRLRPSSARRSAGLDPIWGTARGCPAWRTAGVPEHLRILSRAHDHCIAANSRRVIPSASSNDCATC